MGANFARDLAGGEFISDLRQQIGIHLTSNHYPPVPVALVEPCVKAIEACNGGDWSADIDLPEGTTYKGETSAPASAIVEAHHLEFWLEPSDD